MKAGSRSLVLLAVSIALGAATGFPAQSAAQPSARTFAYSSAAVPALCGLPAGRLKNGVMTVPASSTHDAGEVRLRPGRRDSGRFKGSRRLVHVATLESGTTHGCNDTLVVWGKDGSIEKVVELGKVFRHSDAVVVHRLGFAKGRVRARVLDVAQDADDWIAPIASGRLTLARRSGEVQVVSRATLSERPTARKFVAAVAAADWQRAEKLATPQVVAQSREWFPDGATASVAGRCVSRNADGWPTWVETPYQRMCTMVTSRGDHESGWGLFMERTGWNRYRVSQIEGIAG